MAGLLTVANLPGGFDYPEEFERAVELELTQLTPRVMRSTRCSMAER